MPLSVSALAQLPRIRSDRTSSALRAEVARWFHPASRARVSRFGRIYPGGSRYVCVSAPKSGGLFALYFFHHGAGDWRIYPPWGIGPSIVYWSINIAMPERQSQAAVGQQKRIRSAIES
ncbi:MULTISPECIES: hypothetical protein [Caballeronia]|uniref:Uncharacterized protein n=2 Tax=Caballeronia TaxID=1827195 RepID=A0A158FJL8_CABCO|nr:MULTISPECIES: hypothetical protein [Caballeronia]MCE4568819.1 hypothetical protein [Caballeronia sp. CLC5]BAO86094.1 uncharacterized protein BRPE67_ACDS10390 [Burkholderia sp. RPE67]SAL20116.1 hypothetical protein AWB70_01008 [Caballeronia cordobensis]